MKVNRKVLLFTSHPSSLTLFRIELLSQLSNRGYELHIASSSEPDDLHVNLKAPFIFHRLPLSEFSYNPLSILREVFF